MADCCDDLRAQLTRIENEIAGLDSRYMAASERLPIGAAIAANSAAILALGVNVAIIDGIASGAAAAAATALGIAQAALAGFAVILRLLTGYVTRERLDALENRVSIIERGLDGLLALIQFVSGRVDAQEVVIRSMAALLESMRATIQAVRVLAIDAATLASQALDLARNLEARVKSLEIWRVATVVTLAALVAGAAVMAAAIAVLEGEVIALATAVAIIEAEIVTLTAAVAVIEAEILAIAERLRELRRDIFDVELIARGAEQIARLSVTYAQLARREAAEALEQAQQAYGAAIQALSRANEAIGLVNALERQVFSLAQRIAALTQNIIALEQLTRLMQDSIASLLRRTQRLDDLTRIMQGSIASILRQLARIYPRIDYLERTLEGVISRLEDIWQVLQQEFRGQINLTPCDATPANQRVIAYNGKGLLGMSLALNAHEQALQVLHDDTKCIGDGDTSLPFTWEVKPGIVPQLAITWYASDVDSSSRWTMAIPHPRSDINRAYQFLFPTYQKGRYMMTYRLTDNSTVVLNCVSEEAGLPVLEYIYSLIDPAFKPTGGLTYSLTRINAVRSEAQVTARYAKKFAGDRTSPPLWGHAIELLPTDE
jgi:hypothetical protein